MMFGRPCFALITLSGIGVDECEAWEDIICMGWCACLAYKYEELSVLL